MPTSGRCSLARLSADPYIPVAGDDRDGTVHNVWAGAGIAVTPSPSTMAGTYGAAQVVAVFWGLGFYPLCTTGEVIELRRNAK